MCLIHTLHIHPLKGALHNIRYGIRDLGKMDIEEIKKIFERINATSYSLNAMEIHNARFAGEFKTFVENLTRHPFFDNNGVFSVNEVRRMRDVSFVLVFVITIMSTYFNREDEFITYLSNYNDEFEVKDALASQIGKYTELCVKAESGILNWERVISSNHQEDTNGSYTEQYRSSFRKSRSL